MAIDPERFQRVAELYHAVREASAAERAALLTAADPDLRREVESLLDQPTSDSFLDSSAATVAALLPPERLAQGLQPGTCLGPYRIEGRIGQGGMGEVYRALDTRLDRAVAIKVTRERFSDRFRREARAISAFNHPRICTLYDVGPDYMVMELVAGDTLAVHLRQTPLPLPVALDHALQILDALAQAHARGFVHRDLKPGNIMVTPAGIKILDFGLAKSVDEDSRTATGDAMGTPAYAAPEQRDGLPVDARADIYSFGCVLYEMVTGQRIGPQRQRLAPELDAIVARCLEPAPERRWQSVDEVRQRLLALAAGGPWYQRWIGRRGRSRRTRVGVAALVLVLAGIVVVGWLMRAAPGLGARDAIVLADFVNTTGDPVFDVSLRQGLAVQLEQSPYLGLVPESRLRQGLALMDLDADARLDDATARELCQRLGGSAVVTGSIAQVGTPYQLALRAVDCGSGQTLASTEVDASDRDRVLAALGQASSRLRSRLGESLASVRRFDTPLEQATTRSLDALKSYSEGLRVMTSGAGDDGAIALFQRALGFDPEFALAYGALTLAYTNQGESRLAAEYASKAYALRERVSDPERYFIAARYAKSAIGDIDMAIATCRSWIQAYPRSPIPHTMLAGSIYPVIGEFDQAVAEGIESVRLAPSWAIAHVTLREAYLALGRLDDAAAVQPQVDGQPLRSSFDALDHYDLAFLRSDAAAMAHQLAAATAQAGSAHAMLAAAAATAAFHGGLSRSRGLAAQAIDAAQRAAANEPRATYLAASALREAVFGSSAEAVQRAHASMQGPASRDVQYGAALALAYAGQVQEADALADALATQYPRDTLVQHNYLPALRGKLALARGDASAAVEILRSASAYQLGVTRSSLSAWTALYPVYVRGEAYLAAGEGREAAAQFQLILDHPGIALNHSVAAMARLQLARALALAADRRAAAAAYRAFLEQWRQADADLVVLAQAKAEYARLSR
ncbi:MAG: protein kinase [Dokdonella sp.]|uniref:serine/threonine-protein kinase n=1 Tax=Dokdonella sp. TaxID=2291710 RepID=UPI0025B7D225|nr:serine/threonine-protein kinase [Dokdonella sp.]MBX3701191.1 protein kinase [Dokdonella sp.]